MHDRHFPESCEYPQRDHRVRELEQRVEMFDEAVVIWLTEQLGITHEPVNSNEEGDVENVLMVVRLGTVEFAASGPGYTAALRNLLVLIFSRSEVAFRPTVLPLFGLSELNVEGNDGS